MAFDDVRECVIPFKRAKVLRKDSQTDRSFSFEEALTMANVTLSNGGRNGYWEPQGGRFQFNIRKGFLRV